MNKHLLKLMSLLAVLLAILATSSCEYVSMLPGGNQGGNQDDGLEGEKDPALITCFSVWYDENDNVWIAFSPDTRGNSEKTKLVISSEIDGETVYGVGTMAYQDFPYIKSVVVEEGVKVIGDQAFSKCRSLESVVLGEGVISIEEKAFDSCISLARIEIPASTTFIGEQVFAECWSLTDVYYTGSEEEWAAISIGSGNDYLTNATIHYNYVPEE